MLLNNAKAMGLGGIRPGKPKENRDVFLAKNKVFVKKSKDRFGRIFGGCAERGRMLRRKEKASSCDSDLARSDQTGRNALPILRQITFHIAQNG